LKHLQGAIHKQNMEFLTLYAQKDISSDYVMWWEKVWLAPRGHMAKAWGSRHEFEGSYPLCPLTATYFHVPRNKLLSMYSW